MRSVWFAGAAVTLLVASSPPPADRLEAQEDPFRQRELTAAPDVKGRLQTLRTQITTRKYTFQVGYTRAMDYRLEQLAGLVPPPNLRDRIQEKRRAMRAIAAAPPVAVAGCSAVASSFDWRQHNGSTPVRDQDGCGSCWAFATHGAFEGSYALRNNFYIDSSEQDTLDCNSAGYGCGGGWWAYEELISRGAARESAYPYTASKGTCRTAVPRRYRAEAWDYVSDAETPTEAEMKQALCDHGPLAIAVNVTDAFAGYTGGVFDACAQPWQASASYVPGDLVRSASGYLFECTKAGTSGTSEPTWPPPPNNPSDLIDNTVVWSYRGYINHGVTLIGWDDGKQAWLIKNSWGTGWGETGGHGSERGYMWIKRSCNNVGVGASWVRAKQCTGSKCECN